MKLGYANVDAMLRTMTAKQVIEWQLFEEMEPFGPERLDAGFSYIAQILCNIYRKKNKPALTLDDCMIRFGEDVGQRPKRSWQEMKELAKMLAAESKTPTPVRRRHSKG